MMLIRSLVAFALSPMVLVAVLRADDSSSVPAAQSETATQKAAPVSDNPQGSSRLEIGQGTDPNSVDRPEAANRIPFESDYGVALAATRNDHRPLLVVLEESSSPQRSVQPGRLEGPGVDAELLTPYRICRVDVGAEYGKKVARVFGAEQLPFAAIIDKTGAVVLYKHAGPVTDEQWKTALTQHRLGERRSRAAHTAFYRGVTSQPLETRPQILSYPTYSTQPAVSSPSYCPNCQRRSARGY